MSGHTPGPWEIKQGSQYNHPRFVQGAVRVVCDVVDGSGFSGIPDAECSANARLIAAAPDLLAALKEYHKANRLHHDEDGRLYDLSMAALSKAEAKRP